LNPALLAPLQDCRKLETTARPDAVISGGISDDAAAGAINYQRAMRTDEALPGCKTAELINRNMPTETPRQQQTKTIYS
jgi:hypothetical protein